MSSRRATRRAFITSAGKGLAATAALTGFPAIVPSSVLGASAPSNRINVGAIGTGRISRGHDMPGIWKHSIARIMAACDLDSRRLADAKTLINDFYAKESGKPYDGVTTYANYHELLANKDVDAVVISTPDHWHALIAIHAVQAGKDVYLQKPASLTIAEGRALSDAVHRLGRICQIGSQQRSAVQFRYAAELVRNGRIGQLKTIEVGLPGDPSGDVEAEMPIPKTLNYEMWLGSTPYVFYTEKRVHPQVGYGRPGWLRCEQFGAGMITGWGAHHIDIAQWALGKDGSGPVAVEVLKAEEPYKGGDGYNCHPSFQVQYTYDNGAKVIAMSGGGANPAGLVDKDGKAPNRPVGPNANGVLIRGEDGTLFVSRNTLLASDAKILSEPLKDDPKVYDGRPTNHMQNFVDCVKGRKQPICDATVGGGSVIVCHIGVIALRTGKKLKWDPVAHQFDDAEANKMLSRPRRDPWQLTV